LQLVASLAPSSCEKWGRSVFWEGWITVAASLNRLELKLLAKISYYSLVLFDTSSSLYNIKTFTVGNYM
jgi:hypothetical protein